MVCGRHCRTPLCFRYGRSGGNYDGANRGRGYDRGVGGYQNSQSHGHDVNGPGGAQNRELSRSMSNDNWREAKSSAADDDHRGGGGGGGGGSRGWGNFISVRSPRLARSLSTILNN